MKLFLIVLFIATSFSACTKKETGDEIVVGINPAENAETVEANGKLLIKLVQEKTGLKLKTFVSTDYGSLIEAMRSGQVHLAFIPGFSFVQAEKVAGAKVLLKVVRGGRPFYHSAIITAKNYKSINELKGKTIAWTDPSSASGHIMAKSSLMDLGIDPDTFFSKQIFAGAHDSLVLSVINGTVDAGASLTNDSEGKETIWRRFLKPEEQKKIRILHISKPIPGDTLSTTQSYYDSHKESVDKITAFLINLQNTPEGKKLLKDLNDFEGLIPATSEEYEPLRVAAKRLNIWK